MSSRCSSPLRLSCALACRLGGALLLASCLVASGRAEASGRYKTARRVAEDHSSLCYNPPFKREGTTAGGVPFVVEGRQLNGQAGVLVRVPHKDGRGATLRHMVFDYYSRPKQDAREWGARAAKTYSERRNKNGVVRIAEHRHDTWLRSAALTPVADGTVAIALKGKYRSSASGTYDPATGRCVLTFEGRDVVFERLRGEPRTHTLNPGLATGIELYRAIADAFWRGLR